MIYLDHAATTPPLPCARVAFRNVPIANPSSPHDAGQEARFYLEKSRESIARCINAPSGSVYFCSGATEAANWSILSLEADGYGVVREPTEHHAVLIPSPMQNLFAKASRRGLALARMLANNETGEIYKPPSRKEYRYHVCDATAAVGHIPVDVHALRCDYLFASAHKFGGCPGIGFLYARPGAPLLPMITGGGQEGGKRGGTENLPGALAMAAALRWQTEHMSENTERLTNCVDSIRAVLDHAVPGILWNTPFGRPHLPHILNFSIPGADAGAMTMLLSKKGVMVSPGAACSSGDNAPSHVIMALYGDAARARSAIRVSLSPENTEQECAEAAHAIADAACYLRSIG